MSTKWYRVGLVLISLLAFGVFIPGLGTGFAVGDFMLRVSELSFSQMAANVFMTSRSQVVYWLFNWILSRFFGDSPMGYRLVLLLLHVLSGLVLSDLAKRMTGDCRVGLVAFLFFALYPRNHQVLLWSVTSNKVMGTLLLLLCIDFALQYRQENRKWQGLLAVIFAIPALFTSGGNMALFILLPLVWIIFRREDIFYFDKKTFKASLVLAALAVGFALISIDWGWDFGFVPGDFVPISGLGEGYQIQPIGLSTLKDFLVYNTYLLLPFIPLRILDPSIFTTLLAGACFFFLVAVFGVGIKLPRLAVVWMIVGILPYVLFVPYGNADRYFYLAAAGYALLVGRVVIRLYDISNESNRMGAVELVILSLLGVYMVASTLVIRLRVNEWQIAGEIADRVVQDTLNQRPNPSEDDQMLFVNLPTTYGQAYIYLSGGISEEISNAYQEKGIKMKAHQVSDPDVIAYVESLPAPGEGGETALIIFLYKDGRLIEKGSATADLELLKPKLWIN